MSVEILTNPITTSSSFRSIASDSSLNRSPSPFLELDPQQVVVQLREAMSPSGYRPLVRVPMVLLDPTPLSMAVRGLQRVPPQLAKDYKDMKTVMAFFKDPKLIIIPDSATATKPNQIKISEARAMMALYHAIAAGKTSLRIGGEDPFKTRIFSILIKLMTCPSGRLLVRSLAESDEPIRVFPDEESAVKPIQAEPGIEVGLNLDERVYSVCTNERNEIIFHETPDYILAAPEWCHVLHQNWWKNLSSQDELDFIGDHIMSAPPNGRFPNLEEQFTIAGLKNKRMLCENMIRFELGIPERYCHTTSFFPPFTTSQTDLVDEVVDGFNRMENACYFGALGEVRKLLKAGANPIDGFMKAAAGGQVGILQFMIRCGLNPLIQDSDGDTAIHHAALQQNTAALEFFESKAVSMQSVNTDGRTALHYAAQHGNLDVMNILIRNNVPVNAAATNGDTALSIACEEGHVKAVKLLLVNGAIVTQELLEAVKGNESAEGKVIYKKLRIYYRKQNPLPPVLPVPRELLKRRNTVLDEKVVPENGMDQIQEDEDADGKWAEARKVPNDDDDSSKSRNKKHRTHKKPASQPQFDKSLHA